MLIMGISGALNHDAAVSMVDSETGEILFAAHAERYSKIKNDPNLNYELIREALSYGKPSVIAWYEKPLLKKLRQIVAGQWSSAFTDRNLPREYIYCNFPELHNIPIRYQHHHYTHAASGYFTSNYENAAVVVIDSIGEFDTITIWEGKGDKLKRRYRQSYPQSLGLFYSAMTQRCGLKPNEDEYILMGMAAYGDSKVNIGNEQLVDKMKRDFRIYTDMRFDSAIYHTDFMPGIMYDNVKISDLIHIGENFHRGCKSYMKEYDTEQDHYNFAAATQQIYVEALTDIVKYAKTIINSDNLILMGGCALNCSANSEITQHYKNIWIMPNPGDSGSCIGATQQFAETRLKWDTPYLGHEIKGEYPVRPVLDALLRGEIVGIASGRAEFGPRALGNRTLTADPRGNDIKERLNNIKQRQQFRPFAPMILEEDVHLYFDMPENVSSSPYMQFVAKCKYPEQFPAIIHKDGTSRVQTVNKEQHPGLYELLTKWKMATGCPMLVNTSLNIKGMPIVNDEYDAKMFEEKYGIKVFTSL